jgi:protein-S-isoprenylcysteine O-methyltransferase Ste14
MNRLAAFVYRVATTRYKHKTLLIIAGAIFWYGAFALMVIFAPMLDGLINIHLNIPGLLDVTLSFVLWMTGLPAVIWTIWRFFKAKGTPVPFSPPKKFVADGMYRRVRNPMLLGWTIILIGFGVWRESFSLLVILIPLFLLAHFIYLKFIEEKELERKFGQEYTDYKKRVPMFLPRLYK